MRRPPGRHRRTVAHGSRARRILAAAMATLAVAGAFAVTTGLLSARSGPQDPPGSAAIGSPAGASTAGFGLGRTLPRSEPVGLDIAAIGVHVRDIVRLGRQPDGRLEVPKDWNAVGWYAGGPWPGQLGTAALAGHVDSRSGPAVFFRLGELRPGDVAAVRRADGSIAKFTVYAVEQYPKDEFPTRRVYAPTGRAELRLITCGGRFDEVTHTYHSNVVAYAALSRVTR